MRRRRAAAESSVAAAPSANWGARQRVVVVVLVGATAASSSSMRLEQVTGEEIGAGPAEVDAVALAQVLVDAGEPVGVPAVAPSEDRGSVDDHDPGPVLRRGRARPR